MWASVREHRLSLLLLAIAGAWLLAAGHWILTDTVVPWDAKNQFYAFFRFLASSLHEGYSPFWNPFHYGGHPSVADPQSLLFSPAFVLWALIDPAPSIRAFDLIVYAHLLVGGLSVGILGWRAGWPISASLLAALVFMFGGPASGRLQHTGIILIYALFPLALLLLLLALQKRSLLSAVGFAVVASLLALGRNHEALLLCFVLVAVLVVEVARADHRLRYLRQRAAVMLAMGCVGVGLLAAPLLLTMQFAALSNRPEVTIQSSLEGSLYPANFASLAVPNVFGSLTSTQDYWGPELRHAARGGIDRPFLQLPVRRRRAHHRAALVRRGRRSAGQARQPVDGGRAAGGGALHHGPLLAALQPRLQLCAGHRPVPATDRRQLRAGDRHRPAGRPAARHLCPRGRAARARLAIGGGGGGGARCDRLGGGVLGKVAPRTGVAGRGGEGRPDRAAGDRGAGAGAHRRRRAGWRLPCWR